MLQRYDITMDSETSRLLIKEFAVIEQKTRKSENYDPALADFSLIHEVSFDPEAMRAAIQEGTGAIISELRSPDFYPIGSCAKVIAEKMAGFLNGTTQTVTEVYFDDRTLLSTYIDK